MSLEQGLQQSTAYKVVGAGHQAGVQSCHELRYLHNGHKRVKQLSGPFSHKLVSSVTPQEHRQVWTRLSVELHPDLSEK